MKKLLSLICCAVLILTLAVPAAAESYIQKSKMTTFVVPGENLTISVPKDNITVENYTGANDPAFQRMGEDGGKFLTEMNQVHMVLFSINKKQDTIISLTVNPAPDTVDYEDLTVEQRAEESNRIAGELKADGCDVSYNGVFTGSGFHYNDFCYHKDNQYYWEYVSILNQKCYCLCMTRIGSPFTADEQEMIDIVAETMALRNEPIRFFDANDTMMAVAPRGAHLVPELAALNEADEMVQLETGGYLVLGTEKDPQFPADGNSVTVEQVSKILDIPARYLEELRINGQKYFAAHNKAPLVEGIQGKYLNHMYVTFRDGCGYMFCFAIPESEDSRSEDMIKTTLDSIYFFR